MKIVFDHKFGAQEHNHIEHYSAKLMDVRDDEIDDVLNQGWLTDLSDDGDYYWYQCRSTRCNLEKFFSKDSILAEDNKSKDDVVHYEFDSDVSDEVIENIYLNYCNHHKYTDNFHNEVTYWLDCDYKMVYCYQHKPVAWSKLRMYTENAIETVLFCWNYNDPKERIGHKSLIHELRWAKDNGFKYVYMGPGYEQGSIYKSRINGFEWWTGSEWSTDKNKYIGICERDSSLKTIDELSEL